MEERPEMTEQNRIELAGSTNGGEWDSQNGCGSNPHLVFFLGNFFRHRKEKHTPQWGLQYYTKNRLFPIYYVFVEQSNG